MYTEDKECRGRIEKKESVRNWTKYGKKKQTRTSLSRSTSSVENRGICLVYLRQGGGSDSNDGSLYLLPPPSSAPNAYRSLPTFLPGVHQWPSAPGAEGGVSDPPSKRGRAGGEVEKRERGAHGHARMAVRFIHPLLATRFLIPRFCRLRPPPCVHRKSYTPLLTNGHEWQVRTTKIRPAHHCRSICQHRTEPELD